MAATRTQPVGDGAALLKRRADVRQAERELAAATGNIRVQTARLYPDLSGHRDRHTGELHRSGAGAHTSPTNLYGIGAVLKWEANQTAVRARIQQAKASTKLAPANFDGVVLGAHCDAETALNVYLHDLQRGESTRRARDEVQRTVGDSE